jgi:hypothetical protein
LPALERAGCFEIDDIDRHRKTTDGDLASRAFAMFNDNKTQVEAVIELNESPERTRKLFADWVEMSECIVAGAPGSGYRVLRRQLRGRLTRELVAACLQVVLRDQVLAARVERILGHPMFPSC